MPLTAPAWSAAERAFMREALRLARRPLHRVSPNPRVGAVVVRGARVVGQGYHRGPGTAHAEVAALDEAGSRARGGTLFLNMEPCVHWGRTPPCVDAVVEAGVRRVVCSLIDPDPRVAGRGVRALRRAGIVAEVGLLAEEAEALNRFYLHSRRRGRPWVILKLALTLDGRIADRRGRSRWITGPRARRLVHLLRREVDMVLVGKGTVDADDPELTVRLVPGQNPWRMVVDSRLGLDLGRRLFRARGGSPVLVGTTRAAPAARVKRLAERGIAVWRLPATRQGRVNLDRLLERACRAGVTSILVEGGQALASAFLREGRVNEIRLFYGPALLGDGGSLSGLGDLGRGELPRALRVAEARWRRVGEDFLITGRPLLDARASGRKRSRRRA